MKILSWNIQHGLGCDGRTDLARIVQTAKTLADADVFCFQEVSRGFRTLDHGEDQPARLAELLPDYAPIFRPAVEMIDNDGSLREFGNMLLSRLPVRAVANHLLPSAAIDGLRSMQRSALAILVECNMRPMRILTTHLEYHHHAHRDVQVHRLCALQDQADALAALSFRDSSAGPYRTSPPPVGTVICGDFNMGPDEAAYATMTDATGERPGFVDAWRICHGDGDHLPTTGVFDHKQWPEGPHCRDYFFVSGNLRDRIVAMAVDLETDASDHQPLSLELHA
jgi:endonuclease/exonuclease/phosphatase family metal-dependent hydrolase